MSMDREQRIEFHLNLYLMGEMIKAGFAADTKLESLPEETRLAILEKSEVMKKRCETSLNKVEEEDDPPPLVPCDENDRNLFAAFGEMLNSPRLNIIRSYCEPSNTAICLFDDEDRCGGRILNDFTNRFCEAMKNCQLVDEQFQEPVNKEEDDDLPPPLVPCYDGCCVGKTTLDLPSTFSGAIIHVSLHEDDEDESK